MRQKHEREREKFRMADWETQGEKRKCGSTKEIRKERNKRKRMNLDIDKKLRVAC